MVADKNREERPETTTAAFIRAFSKKKQTGSIHVCSQHNINTEKDHCMDPVSERAMAVATLQATSGRCIQKQTLVFEYSNTPRFDPPGRAPKAGLCFGEA